VDRGSGWLLVSARDGDARESSHRLAGAHAVLRT